MVKKFCVQEFAGDVSGCCNSLVSRELLDTEASVAEGKKRIGIVRCSSTVFWWHLLKMAELRLSCQSLEHNII